MAAFSNFKISTKLNALVGLAIVAMGVVAWVGFRSVRSMDTTSHQLVTNGDRIASHMNADMMHDALRGDVLGAILATDDAAREEARTDVLDHAQKLRDSMAATLRSARPSAGSARAITAIDPVVEAYVATAARLVDLGTKDPAAARLQLAEFKKVFGELEEGLEQVTVQLQAEALVTQSDGVAGAVRSLGTVSGIAGVILIAISLLIGASITRRIARVGGILGSVANCDFARRVEIDSTDEIGAMSQQLNVALEAIDGAFAQVRVVAGEMSSAAALLSATSETIASGASEQAASLEQTAASLEEISATVKQSADNAQHANKVAATSRATAEAGGQVMVEAMQAMSEVKAASHKIGDIISTIDEIALQTNLLALNAAVEAARAGQHGRGFAVVASGVRELAQRRAAAAKEVKMLVLNALERVDRSSAHVERSGSTLREIILGVQKVTEIFDESATAAREQAVGVSQVNEAVSQMDRVTQGNAAQTEELQQVADRLAGQATQLDSLLERFTLTASTVTPTPAPAAPPVHLPVAQFARPARLPSMARRPVAARADSFEVR